MKWYYKILLVVVVIFFVIPFLKNTYLYLTYHHGEEALIKDGQIYYGIFDICHSGFDYRLELYLKMISDTTGSLTFISFGNKIDSLPAETYSWRALLPFQKEIRDTIQLDVTFFPTYIYGIKYFGNDYFDFCAIYKFSNDSLYVSQFLCRGKDSENYITEIQNEQSWGYGDPWQRDFSDVITEYNPFEEWGLVFSKP